MIYEKYHDACRFRHFPDMIQHGGGKYWCPKGGSAMPKNNTNVVLHEDIHDQMKFVINSMDKPQKMPKQEHDCQKNL